PRWALMSLAPFFALSQGARIPAIAWPVLAYMAASLAWSPDPWAGADLVWHFTVLLIIAMIAPADLSRVYWAIGLGLAINTAVGMLQLEGYERVAPVGLEATGLFFNRNQQNCFIAMALVGLLALRDWRAVTLAIFVAIPLLTPPVSRGPMVALAAAGVF